MAQQIPDRNCIFYLAGKITKNDWRSTIVAGLRDTVQDWPANWAWPISENAILGTHHYSGPYFVSDDHGCCHGPNDHGNGLDGRTWVDVPLTRAGVVERCVEALHKSDIVFAWIDASDAYGTFVELGMAAQMGKQIWIAGPQKYPDLWFAYQLAITSYFGPEPALDVFRAMVSGQYKCKELPL